MVLIFFNMTIFITLIIRESTHLCSIQIKKYIGYSIRKNKIASKAHLKNTIPVDKEDEVFLFDTTYYISIMYV